MSLKDQITSDMRDAMRAHDKEKLSALRMLLSSIKQKEVDEQITADDAVIQQIIAKLIKQRKDSVEQYLAGNRKDLADKESAEIKTFEVYLPAQLSDEEIQKIVDEVVTSAGLSGSAAMGKAMGMIKPKVAGKADRAEFPHCLRQDWLSKLGDFIKDVLRDVFLFIAAGSFKTFSVPRLFL